MANFDFKNLILINPCPLDEECYIRAMHASEILDNAKIYDKFEKAVKKMDYLVATSSIETKSDKKHLRNAVEIKDFLDKIAGIDGNIGLVFGREDYGLYNQEISLCDIMLRVPTSESYLSLNLSHAVAIVLFSIFINLSTEKKEKKTISKLEKDKLFSFFSEVLDEINYPDYKKDKTKVMFRRVMGRAVPSKWEYHNLMGVFSKILNKIKSKRKK